MDTINDKTISTEPKPLKIIAGESFMANGKRYTPSETFAIGRFEKVEELEEELLMFSDQRSCHDVMLQAMELVNQYRPGDAHTLMFNKIDSDRRNTKITHYSLRLCTAYINYEGEDVCYLTEETMAAKIKDWSEEGYDVRPFLAFAVSVLTELLKNYKNPIQNILTEAKEIRQSLDEVMDIRNLMGDSGSAVQS